MKRINKKIATAATMILVVGGIPQSVNAFPNIDNSKKIIAMESVVSSKNSVKKVASLSNGQIDSNRSGLYEIKVKNLQEKNDNNSMAGTYVKNVNYEVKDGKKYFIIDLDCVDWMKNISVTVDGGKEISIQPTNVVKRNKNDGLGEDKGKIKFQIGSLDSKVMMHMNVVPMGNARVAFRMVPQKDTLKLIKAYNTKPELNVGENIVSEEGKKLDLMVGVSAMDAEDGDLTSKVKISLGKLDLNNPVVGEYKITYSVKDANGESAAATRKVEIVKKATSSVKSKDNKKLDNSKKQEQDKKIEQDSQNKSEKKKEVSMSSAGMEEKSGLKAKNDIKDNKLPQTGAPLNTGVLATFGTAVAGIGVLLRRKNKR